MKLNISNTEIIESPLLASTRLSIEDIKLFLNGLSDDEYLRKNGEVSSIGGHIRHIIEFYKSFLGAFETGILDYDDRPRNRIIEFEKKFAINVLNEISLELGTITEEKLSQPVLVKESILENFKPEVQSTYSRELVFLASHTTHHLGIIKTILSLTGNHIYDKFGKAPSTIIYESKNKY